MLWLKFCDSNFVTDIFWQKFCDWNFVTQILWLKLCDWKFMTKILWLKFCNWNCVTDILWLKFCDWNFVTEILWLKFLIEIVWLELWDKNFVTAFLWRKFCEWNFVTGTLWLEFYDWNLVTEIYCWNFHRIGPLGRFDLVVAMSVCLSFVVICLSPFHVLDFEAYFASTSKSRMSKIFRDSESLGKSAGKKWSQNWTFLLGSGLKWQRKKKFFFADFALQNMV